MTFDLQTLSDRAEILELSSRYARAIDDKDWDLLRNVFTEDAYADFGLGSPFKGIEAILHASRSIMENLDHTQHFLGNHEIDVEGDRASGRHRLIGGAYLRDAVGEPSLSELGEYVDDYVRTENGWRISHLEFTVSWCEGNMGILGAGISALNAT
ncbi:nuclear transport factor 2 family protein [Amycolatopsis sp. NPDC051371]|uniref:nuclear transport factor 2 family protein n=1 Tax=Amycolatopsis sp. NPDC051371 TaxID=3155800 RepID=UPI003445C360